MPTYSKGVTYRELTYRIVVLSDVKTTPYLVHRVSAKNEVDADIWVFETFDDHIEMAVDAAEKHIKREINKRLDGEDYMEDRMTALGFS